LTVAQSAPNFLPNYPVVARSLNPTVAAINAQRNRRSAGQEPITLDPAARHQLETPESAADLARTKWQNRNDRPGDSDALRRHRHEWHDRNWWHGHCDTIVFVSTGYYFLDGSY